MASRAYLLIALAFLTARPVTAEALYEQVSRCVVRLEYFAVAEGRSGYAAVGTGFFVRRGDDVYLVTARHVSEKAPLFRVRAAALDRVTGEKSVGTLWIPAEAFVAHPRAVQEAKAAGSEPTILAVDVAAARVPPAPHGRLVSFGPDQIAKVAPLPPASVVTFGFPSNLGILFVHQRPVARRGIVALASDEAYLPMPIAMPHGQGRAYPHGGVCVLDMSVRGGESGSPVLLDSNAITLVGGIMATNEKLEIAFMEPASSIRETIEHAALSETLGAYWADKPRALAGVRLASP